LNEGNIATESRAGNGKRRVRLKYLLKLSLRRILPDPVAFLRVEQGLARDAATAPAAGPPNTPSSDND
jgi:hypothetical protein